MINSLSITFDNNKHYLDRYIKFVLLCNHRNLDNVNYIEKHHILPVVMFPEYKSFGNFPWNMAILTARQHVIAHYMLAKAYNTKEMWSAVWCMVNGNNPNFYKRNFKLNSKLYESAKVEFSAIQKIRYSGENSLCYGKFGSEHPMFGKTHSDDFKERMRLRMTGENNPMYGVASPMTGKTHTNETKAKLSKSLKGNKNGLGKIKSIETISKITGLKRTEEQKQRIRESKKDQPIIKCPHCNKEGKKAGMKTWHFDNCKHLTK